MVDLIDKHIGLFCFLFIILLGALFTLVRDFLVYRKEKGQKELVIEKIFMACLKDLPSVLTFGIVSTVVILILSGSQVPEIIKQAFFIVIGYYFGQSTPKIVFNKDT